MSDSVKQILIIGLGLIGSSIAKASKNKGIIVHGFDINESSLSTALEDNIIDSSFDSIESINHKDLVDKIDLIVISVSPKNTQNILNQIKNLWNTNITITETASVKNHLNISSASNIILSHPILSDPTRSYPILPHFFAQKSVKIPFEEPNGLFSFFSGCLVFPFFPIPKPKKTFFRAFLERPTGRPATGRDP